MQSNVGCSRTPATISEKSLLSFASKTQSQSPDLGGGQHLSSRVWLYVHEATEWVVQAMQVENEGEGQAYLDTHGAAALVVDLDMPRLAEPNHGRPQSYELREVGGVDKKSSGLPDVIGRRLSP